MPHGEANRHHHAPALTRPEFRALQALSAFFGANRLDLGGEAACLRVATHDPQQSARQLQMIFTVSISSGTTVNDLERHHAAIFYTRCVAPGAGR
jgi:hypothetical protein